MSDGSRECEEETATAITRGKPIGFPYDVVLRAEVQQTNFQPLEYQTNPLRKNQDSTRCRHLVIKNKANLNLQQSRATVGSYENRHVG